MNCQDHLYRNTDPKTLARRWFFQQCGVGLGSIAATHPFGGPSTASDASLNPLAPKKPPLPAKAKRVIFLFMAGAPSHLELFDNKPQLTKFDGTLRRPELLKRYRAGVLTPNP